MQFNVFEDEALESCLLRRCFYQGCERFSHFAEDLEERLFFKKGAITGTLPKELSRFNIYKSQVSSEKRLQALWVLDSEIQIKNVSLADLALWTSDKKFSPSHISVFRQGISYPQAFLRTDSTPICTECLKEHEYIRQCWQQLPYQACHIHHCDLLHRCPECNSPLNYQEAEAISLCKCGFDLRNATTQKADVNKLVLSQWLMGLPTQDFGMANGINTSSRYGFLHWYLNRYDEIDLKAFINYCASFPHNLYQELEAQIELAETIRVKEWRSVSFNEMFGDLLNNCRQLPSRYTHSNIVLKVVLEFFTQKVKILSLQNKANFTCVLLSPLEASSFLSCTLEEIYRLYHLGKITSSKMPTLHSKLHPHQAAFSLKTVIMARFLIKNTESEDLVTYVPNW